MIDAMSSLGGVTVDWQASQADFIVSSANKCVQGIPGFGFVFAKLSSLHKCQGMYVLSYGRVRAALPSSKRAKPYGWSSLEVIFNIKIVAPFNGGNCHINRSSHRVFAGCPFMQAQGQSSSSIT